MSKKKKSPKKPRSLGEARVVAPGSSPGGGATMPFDAAQAEERRDPRDGTAVIAPVTATMLDHAAHEAAALARGAARHATAPDDVPQDGAPEAVYGGAPSPEDPAGLADGSVAAGAEATRHVVGAADAAADGAFRSATGPTQEATTGSDSTVEAARDTLPGPKDAMGLYGAKVLEMMRANAASTTALFAALVQARSVPEALSLNADHLRRQMETLTCQGRELAALAQRMAIEALQPPKGPTDR